MTKLKSQIVKNLNVRNKQASFEYYFLENYIAGICLKGTEIKSLRLGKVQLQDSHCFFKSGELWVKNLSISTYQFGNIHNHDPKADRKLLLNKRELRKLEKGLEENGVTIIVTRIFITEKGLAKLEIALAKGKKLFDKREDIKKRDVERETNRRF